MDVETMSCAYWDCSEKKEEFAEKVIFDTDYQKNK